MKWLVSLCLTPTSRWSSRRPPCSATRAGAPGCRRRGGSRGRSCHPRPRPLTGPGPALLPAARPAGHGSRARWPTAARRRSADRADPGPVRARARGRGSRRSSTTRIVFSSGTRYRPAIGSHGARSRARSAWLARPIHCPTAVSRSFPAAVNAQTAIATRQASGYLRPRGERGSGSASSRSHVPAGRSCPPGPGSTTRAPTRDNATAGMPHLVHADLRDLHDRVACPPPSTVRFRPITHMPDKTGQLRNTPEPWPSGLVPVLWTIQVELEVRSGVVAGHSGCADSGRAAGAGRYEQRQREGEQPVQHRMSGFSSSGCGQTVYGPADCPFPGMLAVRHHGWAGS